MDVLCNLMHGISAHDFSDHPVTGRSVEGARIGTVARIAPCEDCRVVTQKAQSSSLEPFPGTG
jgi:hypothetical protein